jgi:replicative DNA helicase
LPDEQVFYSTAHQQVYLAIRDLVQLGDHADILTVTQQLRHRGTLERTGGPGFVANLTSKINSAAHFETHCRILQEQHARRVVIRAGTGLTGPRVRQHARPAGITGRRAGSLNLITPQPRNPPRPNRGGGF